MDIKKLKTMNPLRKSRPAPIEKNQRLQRVSGTEIPNMSPHTSSRKKYGKSWSNPIGSILKKYAAMDKLNSNPIVHGTIAHSQALPGRCWKYFHIVEEPFMMKGIRSYIVRGMTQKKIVGKISKSRNRPEESSVPKPGLLLTKSPFRSE